MRNIYILSGLPGSGKTTWTYKYAGPNDIILHRDDCREILRQKLGLIHANEVPAKTEYAEWIDFIRRTLNTMPNSNVFIDQTTLTQGSLNKLIDAMLPSLCSNDNIVIHVIHTNFAECKRRNEARAGDARVPDMVMESMQKSTVRNPIQIDATRERYPHLWISIEHDVTMEGI